MTRRRTYSTRLRRRAVEEVLDRGRPVVEVAREFGIDSPERLHNWVRRGRLERGQEVEPPRPRPRRGEGGQPGGPGSAPPRPDQGRRAQMPRGFISEKRTLPRR